MAGLVRNSHCRCHVAFISLLRHLGVALYPFRRPEITYFIELMKEGAYLQLKLAFSTMMSSGFCCGCHGSAVQFVKNLRECEHIEGINTRRCTSAMLSHSYLSMSHSNSVTNNIMDRIKRIYLSMWSEIKYFLFLLYHLQNPAVYPGKGYLQRLLM